MHQSNVKSIAFICNIAFWKRSNWQGALSASLEVVHCPSDEAYNDSTSVTTNFVLEITTYIHTITTLLGYIEYVISTTFNEWHSKTYINNRLRLPQNLEMSFYLNLLYQDAHSRGISSFLERSQHSQIRTLRFRYNLDYSSGHPYEDRHIVYFLVFIKEIDPWRSEEE